jgi:hypothetical protein
MGTVISLDPADPRWDRLVEGHERATVYQLGAWPQILREAYGFTPACLAIEEAGELRGVLPLIRSAGLVSGQRLRSLPALPPAGPLATSNDGEVQLLAEACGLVKSGGADALTLVSRTGGYEKHVEGLAAPPRHPAWIVPLPADPDELRAGWRKSSKNLHRSLNKAAKSGLVIREGLAESDLRAFFRLYMHTMKAHHSLPRAYAELSKARELLRPGVFRVFLVEHDGEPIAGGVFNFFRDSIDLLYAGSERSMLDLRPNHALYWHVMRLGIETGYRHFDFGKAKPGSELERFKAQWSAEPVPEYRYDFVVNPGVARADKLRHSGDRMGRAGGASRREKMVAMAWNLAPLPITRVAGRLVYRYL